jgi:hypothetical protein
MPSNPKLNPHTIWATRRREQALRNATACQDAVHDVMAFTVWTAQGVTMTVDGYTDIGTLRLEGDRLVFAGAAQTRMVEFASILLLGTRETPGAPVAAACSVNSSDYDATMLFWHAIPLEYHIAAWYLRWLENSDSYPGVRPAAMVELPHHPR